MKNVFIFTVALLFIFSFSTGYLWNQSHEKDDRVKNLLEENSNLTDKVSSLEKEKGELEETKGILLGNIKENDQDLAKRDELVRALALHLSTSTTVNAVASIAVSEDGGGDLWVLGNIFAVSEDIQWTKQEENKLCGIGKKIHTVKEVVVK